MTNKIVERIQRQVGDTELVEKLVTGLSASDLQSLLIEVYRRRAEALTPRHLLEQYGRDLFVQPSAACPRAQLPGLGRREGSEASHSPDQQTLLQRCRAAAALRIG